MPSAGFMPAPHRHAYTLGQRERRPSDEQWPERPPGILSCDQDRDRENRQERHPSRLRQDAPVRPRSAGSTGRHRREAGEQREDHADPDEVLDRAGHQATGASISTSAPRSPSSLYSSPRGCTRPVRRARAPSRRLHKSAGPLRSGRAGGAPAAAGEQDRCTRQRADRDRGERDSIQADPRAFERGEERLQRAGDRGLNAVQVDGPGLPVGAAEGGDGTVARDERQQRVRQRERPRGPNVTARPRRGGADGA